jgi:GGDEF domain-containing protein
MRAHFRRPYDLIVRVGGDEFLCGIQNISTEEASKRFERINADLSDAGSSVTVGLAELTEADSLEDLIVRANAALRAKRQQRSSPIS